jgi:hypothetical protein
MGSDTPAGLSLRAGCLISLAVGVAGFILLLAVAALVARGELVLRRGQPDEWRLWLVRGSDATGFGLSTSGRDRSLETAGEACFRTRVRFLLLRSTEPYAPVTYCDCYRPVGARWEPLGPCPAPP